VEKSNYKISIVMPVYNVERYLRACLDSVIAQTLQDMEVIIVNDGSKDSSLSILEEYQGKYPELMKVFTTENHGVSHARNYGMSKASGDYILFVDSDDYIEADMCEKLYRKAVTDGNDIVICGRYNVYEREHIGEFQREAVETNLISQNFELSVNKFEFAHISPFPWDKLFKRELLQGMTFPEKMRFEDLVFTFEVICKSKCIGVVNEPLYNYRRTTQGGFLNSFSEQTLDIVKAFELLFDYMRQNKYFDLYFAELEYICARHFLYRFGSLYKRENKGKLSIKIRIIRETLDFLDEQLPAWRINHYLKYSSGALKGKLKEYTNKNRMIYRTVVREYTPHFLIKIFSKLRSRKKTWRRRIRKWKRSTDRVSLIKRKLPLLAILSQAGSVYYTRLYEKLPIAPMDILFESKHGEDIAGNIFALIRELTNSAYKEFNVLLAMEKSYMQQYKTLLANYEIHNVKMIEIRSRDYMRALATAKYLVTDTSFPPYFIKKKEQVYLNTWHGTPLKAMGRIVPSREYALGNVQRNYLIADYLLYQNDFSRDVFLNDYMLKDIYPGTIMLSGYPRNSIFFQKNRYQQIRKECGIEDKQVIIYMPTWRGLLHQKETDRQLENLNSYFSEIDKKLKDSQIFYVKLHPYVKAEMDFTGYKHIKEFPSRYETYDFLNSSDALVTDYSSIMFDYGATKRKIVLFTYDREEYLTGRGLYLDLDTLELPKADTVQELINELNADKKEYPEFYKQFCSYDSERTPRQVIETLLFGHTEKEADFKLEKVKPQDRKKVFIFIKGMKRDDYTGRLIRTINQIDTNIFDVYVGMKADDAKKASEMLSQFRKEINYFPIMYEVNYTRLDYILCKLRLNNGINISATNHRIDKVMKREIMKYFGDIQFDYVIHHSELDRMIGNMCTLLGGKTIYNFKYFNFNKYRGKGKYRKQVNYFIKRFPLYSMVVATKEVNALRKKEGNILINEEPVLPMAKLLKEVTQHEGRSHNIS
jgi:CDP-glycerol glycerophosphotransferase (TagB/SpsB family)/glycosyltransferase involved in cell wall biosynthesis